MNKACDLLKNTDTLIGDIALHVGYENQLNFSRAFKKTFGISPREWRKRN
jgi:AraC-like DNA-binding protein